MFGKMICKVAFHGEISIHFVTFGFFAIFLTFIVFFTRFEITFFVFPLILANSYPTNTLANSYFYPALGVTPTLVVNSLSTFMLISTPSPGPVGTVNLPSLSNLKGCMTNRSLRSLGFLSNSTSGSFYSGIGLAVWGMLGRVATQCMVVAREIPLPQAWGITGMWKAEARAEIFKNSDILFWQHLIMELI